MSKILFIASIALSFSIKSMDQSSLKPVACLEKLASHKLVESGVVYGNNIVQLNIQKN